MHAAKTASHQSTKSHVSNKHGAHKPKHSEVEMGDAPDNYAHMDDPVVDDGEPILTFHGHSLSDDEDKPDKKETLLRKDGESDKKDDTGKKDDNKAVVKKTEEKKKDNRRDLWMHSKIECTEFDETTQMVHLQGFLDMVWVDPDLPNKVDYKDKGWSLPDSNPAALPVHVTFLFKNQKNLELLMNTFNYNPTTHLVTWSLNFSLNLPISLELTRFPFDRQFLAILVNIRTPQWKPLLKPPEEWKVPFYLCNFHCAFTLSPSVSGWSVRTPWVDYLTPKSEYQGIRYLIRLERQYGYYMSSVVFPCFTIIMFLAAAFYSGGLADRMGVVLTVLLTIVAFKFAVGEKMPVISYLTLMDEYILICYGVALLVAIENMYVALTYDLDEGAKGADDLDELCAIIFVAAWGGIHLILMILIYYGAFFMGWEELEIFQCETKAAKMHETVLTDVRPPKKINECDQEALFRSH